MALIGLSNMREPLRLSKKLLFDWAFTQGAGTSIPDAEGRIATINDGTISSLDPATAWATPAFLTCVQSTIRRGAWADIWQTAPLDFVRGDCWFIHVKGIFTVPTSGADIAFMGTLNGGSSTRNGWALRLYHSAGASPGRGYMNVYSGGALVGTIAITGGSMPVWVDGALHSMSLFISGATGRVRRYVDGIMYSENTVAGIVRKDIRTNFTPDGASGHLMIGAGQLNTALGVGGGQFQRIVSLYRETEPIDASIDRLAMMLHQNTYAPVRRPDWDRAL